MKYTNIIILICTTALCGCFAPYDRDFNCPIAQQGSCQPLDTTYRLAVQQSQKIKDKEFQLLEVDNVFDKLS